MISKNLETLKKPEKPKEQSTRKYEASPVILEMRFFASEKGGGKIYDKEITPDTKVCLLGDGQGMDTDQFLKMKVNPENIQSINYEQSEVDEANNKGALKDKKVKMKQGDATQLDDLIRAGIKEGSQDIVTLMHVLEVPVIKGETEKRLVENIVKILKPDGELLVSQYKTKFVEKKRKDFKTDKAYEEYKKNLPQEIKAEDLQKRWGDNWKEEFEKENGMPWREGMRFGEISNIRTKEELIKLFEPYFDIKFEEKDFEYVLRMKKKADINL